MGEPAHDRANKNTPVISFRAPTPEFKECIRAEAESHQMTVQDYMVSCAYEAIASGAKKYGGAQARYNKKRPTIAFRAPTPGFKRILDSVASQKKMSTSAYICGVLQEKLAEEIF